MGETQGSRTMVLVVVAPWALSLSLSLYIYIYIYIYIWLMLHWWSLRELGLISNSGWVCLQGGHWFWEWWTSRDRRVGRIGGLRKWLGPKGPVVKRERERVGDLNEGVHNGFGGIWMEQNGFIEINLILFK